MNFITAFLTSLLLVFSTLASAQTQSSPCGPFDSVEGHLKDRYGEEPILAAVAANESVMMIYANPDGGTWTAVVVGPNGASCIVASGESWSIHRPDQTSTGDAL